MNCAWHSLDPDGSHGICDDCMQKYFGVDPASIHAEIAVEAVQEQTSNNSIMMQSIGAESLAEEAVA